MGVNPEIAGLQTRSVSWWLCFFGHRWTIWKIAGPFLVDRSFRQRRQCWRCGKWQGEEVA